MRTCLESCASIVQAVVCRPPCCCLDEISCLTLFAQEMCPNPRYYDAVAAAVSHKHHSIICVGAGLIQFVYGSHSKCDHGTHSIKNDIFAFFRASFHTVSMCSRALMKMLTSCGDVLLPCVRYTCVKGDCRTFLIVWGQSNRAIFIYPLRQVNIWYFKRPHHLTERCLRHGIEGVVKVNVDSINSVALSPSFLFDEKAPFAC